MKKFSFPTTWTLAIILCILLVFLSMAIALYKLRERLVGYTEEVIKYRFNFLNHNWYSGAQSCSRDRCHLVPSTSKVSQIPVLFPNIERRIFMYLIMQLKSVRGDNDPNKVRQICLCLTVRSPSMGRWVIPESGWSGPLGSPIVHHAA